MKTDYIAHPYVSYQVSRGVHESWLTTCLILRSIVQGRFRLLSSQKHVHVMYTPLNPTFFSKTGECSGIHIFAPKHRLWVLVRTTSDVPTIYVSSKNMKNIKIFQLKFSILKAQKCLFIAWASFRNVKSCRKYDICCIFAVQNFK